MKRLFLHLLTANFAGTFISLVVFLINTYRLSIQEYFLYSYVNSALIIAGLLVLYGTDNLALSSYSRFSVATVYNNVKRIKFRMLFLGLLLFFVALLYFIYINPQYQFSLVLCCFGVSLPFLFSFYYTHTHFYIHTQVYNKFVKTALVIKLLCLLPIFIAAYFQRYLLITTLTANSIAVMLPALQLNRLSLLSTEPSLEIEEKPFSSLRLFENFVINSFPVLYINAVFFLFSTIGTEFIKERIFVYASRIFIIFAGIASSVISILVSSHLKKFTDVITRFKGKLFFVVLPFIFFPLLLRYFNLPEPCQFISWTVFELIAIIVFFLLFFINTFNPHNSKLVPGLILVTFCFFLIVKLYPVPLQTLMFERALFVALLIVINVLVLTKKKSVTYE